MRDMIVKAKDASEVSPIACVVENISLPWCVQLGAALQLDPRFFVEVVRPVDNKAAENSLKIGLAPGTYKELQSSQKSKNWWTIRGFVDLGLPEKELKEEDLVGFSRRQHDLNLYSSRLSHTDF